MRGLTLAPNLIWKKALGSPGRTLDWESRGQDSSPGDLGQVISLTSVSHKQNRGLKTATLVK